MLGGGGDRRRMSIDGESPKPLSNNSRALVVVDPLALKHGGPSSPFPREDMPNGMFAQQAETIVNHSKKLQDELQELGEKIKHHEHNVKYLKALTNKLDDSINDMQVSIGKHRPTSFSKGENEASSSPESEEEIIQRILKYEKSAAAIFCSMKNKPEGSDHPLMKDVLGAVATLGKVNDPNLSRLLSEYLGLDTMLAVVCKTFEGVKALETYGKDGSINKRLGIHALAATMGRTLDDRSLVVCLENLRPYVGEFIADDPQRRLDLVKPRLINGETPPGFLGFAVNMITIENTNLYCVTKTGRNLRETLFYNLFSNLQVYKSREDMLKACPCITHGAVSLDGGMIRSPGVFSLGQQRGDIYIKFPSDSKRPVLPVNYCEIENQLKEAKWKKDRTQEDMQREQGLLDHIRFKYEAKKQEFVQFLAESSSYATQVGRSSTPR